MKKPLIYGIGVIFILLLGWRLLGSWMSSGKQQNDGRRARAIAVETTSVSRREMIDGSEFTGTLLPEASFTVAPKIPGRLVKLSVNLGDSVTNNALIAILDDEEYKQQLIQANTELDVSRANLIDAKNAHNLALREFDRIKALREQKIASVTELDQAENAYLAAQARYEVARVQIKNKEAAVKAAEVRLSYTRIRAAWENGSESRNVAERFADEGEMLRANDPIVTIVSLRNVIAVIRVVEKDFPKIRIGQTAQITTDAHPGKVFSGRIVRKAPVLDETTRQARVEIEVPNLERDLTGGMFVRVRLQFETRDNATVVPESAIVNRDGRKGVFIVDDSGSRADFVPVETGTADSGFIEILSPKLSGSVVTLGHHLLEDGAAVLIAEGDRPDPQAPLETPAAGTGAGQAGSIR